MNNPFSSLLMKEASLGDSCRTIVKFGLNMHQPVIQVFRQLYVYCVCIFATLEPSTVKYVEFTVVNIT